MVYAGSEEGNTFVALGQVVRALGRGLNVCIMKFGSSGCEYGELMTLRESHNTLSFLDFTNEFPRDAGCGEHGALQSGKALESVRNAIQSMSYDLLVLCGFMELMKSRPIDENEAVDLLSHRPKDLHVLITGSYSPESLIEAADLVTEIKEMKSKRQTDRQ